MHHVHNVVIRAQAFTTNLVGYAQGQQTAERTTDDDRFPPLGDADNIQELKHLYPT